MTAEAIQEARELYSSPMFYSQPVPASVLVPGTEYSFPFNRK